MEKLIEFFSDLWLIHPNTVIGTGLAILVFLGIYIFLFNDI